MKPTALAILLLFANAACGTDDQAHRRANAVAALATSPTVAPTTSSEAHPRKDSTPSTATTSTMPTSALQTATFALG